MSYYRYLNPLREVIPNSSITSRMKYKKDDAKAEDDNGSSSDQLAPNRRATMESDEQQEVADELRNEIMEPESKQ